MRVDSLVFFLLGPFETVWKLGVNGLKESDGPEFLMLNDTDNYQ